jgi:hypothetical protein
MQSARECDECLFVGRIVDRRAGEHEELAGRRAARLQVGRPVGVDEEQEVRQRESRVQVSRQW